MNGKVCYKPTPKGACDINNVYWKETKFLIRHERQRDFEHQHNLIYFMNCHTLTCEDNYTLHFWKY